MTTTSTVLLLLGNILCNTVGNLLMKIGMKNTEGVNLGTVGGLVRGLLLNPALIVGVLAYVASLGFYLFVLKTVKLSVAYPISVSSAIILVTILSGVILKENIAWQQITGSIIILFGIFVLTR